MSEQCLYHKDHESRIMKNENNVEELYNKVNCIDKLNTRMEVILENLSKLPSAIESLERSMIAMQSEIKQSNEKIGSLEKKFEGLNTQVSTIDSRDKISILDWLKQHWFELVLAGSILATYVKK